MWFFGYIIVPMTHTHVGSVYAAHKRFAHPERNVSALGIEPGMHVADFGAGSGAYVRAMAERMLGSGRIYAIDIQKDLLRRIHNEARQRGHSNVDILWGDLEEPHGAKVPDNSLDVVLISNLLFQVGEKANVVKEAYRVLRPLGRLAVIDWTESFGGMGPRREDVVTVQEVSELARDTGFSFVREFEPGAHHFGLLFRKPKKH